MAVADSYGCAREKNRPLFTSVLVYREDGNFRQRLSSPPHAATPASEMSSELSQHIRH